MAADDAPQLGDRVREIVTGYEGVVTGVCEYLWGCHQRLVARADKDGKPDGEWLDIGRLEVVERAAVKPVTVAVATAGADIPPPVR